MARGSIFMRKNPIITMETGTRISKMELDCIYVTVKSIMETGKTGKNKEMESSQVKTGPSTLELLSTTSWTMDLLFIKTMMSTMEIF